MSRSGAESSSAPSVRLAIDFIGPVNIGSEEMVTINEMAAKIMKIADKELRIKHIDGPLGVRGRNSDNKLMRAKLGWEPKMRLDQGLEKTYTWIEAQLKQRNEMRSESLVGV
jgi:GDP-D-mannose 3',5'-epimerase